MSASLCDADTRNVRTPAWRTADAFCANPPMAPIEPSSSIVPVTATSGTHLLVRSPGDSSSMSVSVKAAPAERHFRMRSESMLISNGGRPSPC